MTLLSIRDLDVRFGSRRVVAGLSLDVAAGETLALMGASGSGKTTAVLGVLGLLPAQATVSAKTATFLDAPLLESGARRFLGRGIGCIFQDPRASLAPHLRIGAQLEESLEIAGVPESSRRATATKLLEDLGVTDPARRLAAWPHELSGGLCQRVAIAMALAGNPKLLVADEPTTALDVTVAAQFLRLLSNLAKERGLSVLLISHDLGVVCAVADRVAVLHEGAVVESGPTERSVGAPSHPETRRLFAALKTESAP